MKKKQYLLTCESKKVQHGRIISRCCGTDNLDKAKKVFMDITKNIVGLKLEGSFSENFTIVKKELIAL